MERNKDIKSYISHLFAKEDKHLRLAKNHSKKSNLPKIAISEKTGKLLSMLVSISQAKKILEIGTLGGYSTLWLLKNLPSDGNIITIESSPFHGEIARKNLSHDKRVELRIGNAHHLLSQIAKHDEGPFDLIFIDADKDNYPHYFHQVLALTKKGSLIISDNLIPKRGKIGQPYPEDINAKSIYAFNELIAYHPRLDSIILPMIREDGRIDGLGLSHVRLNPQEKSS